MVDEISTQMIIVAITSIISFIVGWGLSIINDRRNRKHASSRAKESLISELNATKKSISELKPLVEVTPENDDSSYVKIVYGHFHTSAYDSMLFSGSFRELDAETQRKIVELYEDIKLVNNSRMRLQEIITTNTDVNKSFIRNITDFGKNIDDRIKKISDKIPSLIEHLQKI